jgi:DNA-binding transcriptional regulator YhcF (GntR family)
MVRRVFQELEDGGALRVDRRQITLLAPQAAR